MAANERDKDRVVMSRAVSSVVHISDVTVWSVRCARDGGADGGSSRGGMSCDTQRMVSSVVLRAVADTKGRSRVAR